MLETQVRKGWDFRAPLINTTQEENRRLKRMVADLSLDKQMLQDVLSKKL